MKGDFVGKMGLAKAHLRVAHPSVGMGMGLGTDIGKLFLTVKQGREMHH